MANELISYCVFTTNNNGNKRLGARIKNNIYDLSLLCELGLLNNNLYAVLRNKYLNDFIALNKKHRQMIKQQLLNLSTSGTEKYNMTEAVVNMEQVMLHLPIAPTGYSDFYTCKNHATHMGMLLRPDNPLLPNWPHMPIAYNGRVSSIVINSPVVRPHGQILLTDNKPHHLPSRKLDFEVEVGVIIGKNSCLGVPVSIQEAQDYIFGVCILNDWSARDIQQWESQPAGPFNSKDFLTTISPFIVPIEELEPFKIPLAAQNPEPLPYLKDHDLYTYDINLEVQLQTAKMEQATIISCSNLKYSYWSIAQWIAQHTVAGCNLQVGDILASGTLSGTTKNSYGSLMEISKNGTDPFILPNGEIRTFLEDGDSLSIRGYCHKWEQVYELGNANGIIFP